MQPVSETGQALDVYLESQQRYTEYYLKFPKNASDAVGELEAEIPNLQHAFHWTLQAGNNKPIPEFWNDVKDLGHRFILPKISQRSVYTFSAKSL